MVTRDWLLFFVTVSPHGGQLLSNCLVPKSKSNAFPLIILGTDPFLNSVSELDGESFRTSAKPEPKWLGKLDSSGFLRDGKQEYLLNTITQHMSIKLKVSDV